MGLPGRLGGASHPYYETLDLDTTFSGGRIHGDDPGVADRLVTASSPPRRFSSSRRG